MNETIKTIKNHRSIREYLNKDIPKEHLDAILEAAQAMPTSINGQQVSVIVVKDKNTKEKIAELAGGQPYIAKAPVFLVFVADFYKTYLAGKKAGEPQVIHESIESTAVGTFDSGLAMGAAIIAAESLGLGIVPIGGIRRNPEEMIKLLELPEYTYPLVGLCIGYAENNSKQKPRLPKETFIHNEKYQKDNLIKYISDYDKTMEMYLKEIGLENEENWSSRTASIYKQVYFPNVYPTMKSQGFKNDK
ncbi:FMN reductase [NAD(P)H] [Hypnocyclicus thermotrophus]|uniref:FMN reductase [NAD(P)H] n=1 Tax=Hypnocyclicus thermotrophus TaxID=1627895 RepID=A0AA46E0F2_9FUSO|nr:FMN reductase [NAD(P)H] [Hypnocyclicus thermotrophus]